MSSSRPYRARTAPADFAPHPGRPGKPSALSPDQRQVIGDRLGRHPELRGDPRSIEDGAAAPVELDDAAVRADALAEVLVGGADDHLIHLRIGGRHRRGCGQRVVGLELHHRPHGHPRGRQSVLQDRELALQVRVDALARLVGRPQLVSKRLDDVVGGDADVRGPLLEQRQHRAHHAPGGPHLLPVAVHVPRHGEEVAKQLVGAVDQVDVHRPTTRRTGEGPAAPALRRQRRGSPGGGSAGPGRAPRRRGRPTSRRGRRGTGTAPGSP